MDKKILTCAALDNTTPEGELLLAAIAVLSLDSPACCRLNPDEVLEALHGVATQTLDKNSALLAKMKGER